MIGIVVVAHGKLAEAFVAVTEHVVGKQAQLLAVGIEPTVTADGMGAILRSPGAPPWNFRSRGNAIGIEESLVVDSRGEPNRTVQLVVSGDTGPEGAEVQWQFRRSS